MVDFGWTSGAYKAALSLLLHQQDREENMIKKLMGQNKDRKITEQMTQTNMGKTDLIRGN